MSSDIRPGSHESATLPPPPSGESAVGNRSFDFLAPAQAADELGRLGHFRVLKVLGMGGMGVVFQGEDSRLHRPVALKAILPEVAQKPGAKDRFLREARTAANIEHDHIVAIYHVDEERGVPFIAMPLLKGMSLDDWLKQREQTGGGLKLAQVLKIGREIARGLSAAHERGLIHRDIKPANIWLDSSVGGRVKILDFGLARATSGEQNITQSGVIVGTPSYMAPEQAQSQAIDGRADLFSLGVVLYRLCTGTLPFKGADVISTLMALATYDPPPPKQINANLPEALSALVMKLIAKDPAQRPASAKEVVQALQSIERTLPSAREAEDADLSVDSQTQPGSTKETPTADTVTNPFSNLSAMASGTVAVEGACPAAASDAAKGPAHAKRGRGVLIGAIAGLLTLIVAGVMFFLQTPDGLVRIEIDDPAIKLVIDQEDGVKIDGADKQTIMVKPGKHGLTIARGDNFKFDTTNFELKKGEKTTLKIQWLEGKGMVVLRDDKKIGEKDVANVGNPGVTPMPVNYALELDDGGVEAPDVRFAEYKDLTLEAYVLVDPQPSKSYPNPMLLGQRGHVDFFVDRANREIFLQGRAASKSASVPLPQPKRWMHIAGVQSGRTLTMYVDGKKIGEFPHTPKRDPEGEKFFRMGSKGIRYAAVDEVRVSKVVRYTRDFTPAKRFEPDADTVALYHCDEGKGEVLKDSSKNGYDGKIVGAKWVKADAAPPPAVVTRHGLEFDGKQSHVMIEKLRRTNNEPRTIEAYLIPATVNIESKGGLNGIIGYRGTAGVMSLLQVKDTWKLLTLQKPASHEMKGAPDQAKVGVRTHLAGIWTGSECRLFVDGKRVALQDNVTKTLFTPDFSGTVLGAVAKPGFDRFWAGIMTEVRISKGIRYDNDFAPAPRFEPDADTLALYQFDEGSGDVLTDSSGNGHDGKIVGAKWVKVEPNAAKSMAPSDARDFAGHQYKFFPDRMNWKDAKSQCERLGGHLAVVDSIEKHEFLYRLMRDAGGTDAWLGATDEEKEGTWVWVTGRPMVFQHWAAGQPNGGTKENCLLMTTFFQGKWCDNPLDANPNHKPGFFCEWSSGPAAIGFVPLFNGKDLTGWCTVDGGLRAAN